MKIKFIYILPALFIALWSCLPEPLETEVEQAESKLVISSQVIPGNFILITVSRSFSALEGSYGVDLDEDDLDQFLVKNARVVLNYANRTDTLFTTPDAPGVYLSLLRLEDENESFELHVYDSLTKESVTASSTMLNRVSLNSAEIKREPIEAFDDTLHKLNLIFTDPPEDNWYVLNVFDPGAIGQSDFSFGNNEGSVYTQLITDKAYEGSEIEIKAEIIGFELKDTAVVMFSNISEEYFRFLDARARGGNIISSVTGEPINHPTNVQGGYGYFNTHNPSIRQVVIKD